MAFEVKRQGIESQAGADAAEAFESELKRLHGMPLETDSKKSLTGLGRVKSIGLSVSNPREAAAQPLKSAYRTRPEAGGRAVTRFSTTQD